MHFIQVFLKNNLSSNLELSSILKLICVYLSILKSVYIKTDLLDLELFLELLKINNLKEINKNFKINR